MARAIDHIVHAVHDLEGVVLVAAAVAAPVLLDGARGGLVAAGQRQDEPVQPIAAGPRAQRDLPRPDIGEHGAGRREGVSVDDLHLAGLEEAHAQLVPQHVL